MIVRVRETCDGDDGKKLEQELASFGPVHGRLAHVRVAII
jgi:hypothetical protein